MILEEEIKEMDRIRADLLKAEGRISYTMDLWTDPNLQPFMAVTAHFCLRNAAGSIEYQSGLVAFEYTPGSHSGECLFLQLFKIIDDLGVIHKVCTPIQHFMGVHSLTSVQIGQITMDNASNNNTLMAAL